MKLIAAFLRLVRWPNLIFIILTQFLFYYCILLPTYQLAGRTTPYFLQAGLFIGLVISSVLIAAAGYIINDYFDLNIDQVNKPQAIVVQKIIRRRWAIVWHLSLSAAGVFLAFVVSYRLHSWIIAPANLACVILLWQYSTTFKKKLLIGNLIISLLTAWVVLVLYVGEWHVRVMLQDPLYHAVINRVFKLAVLYGGFAFIISLVREVVKDMEDMLGDEKYGCRTMPLVWGVPAAKVFAGVWLVVLMLGLGVMMVYSIMLGWYLAALYCLLVLILPLGFLLRRLYKAVSTEQFHRTSNWIKWLMLAGILSMILFKFPN